MPECKHELKDLVGMADGIHCRACGKIFPTMPAPAEAEKKPAPAEAEKKPAPKAAPKKGGKTNARR